MIDLTAKPFYLDQEGIDWVEKTKKAMTFEEKIAQLFIGSCAAGENEQVKADILRHPYGGLMFRPGNSREIIDTARFIQQNVKIPMLLAANLEAGGDGIAQDGTNIGNQMLVAATGDPENAYRLGKVACSEGMACGINWAFAPVVDIDINWRNPITNVRTYGSDADRVLACGLAYKRAADEEGTAVSIKHFPGDGVDEVDQHLLTSVNSLSCEEWDATYGKVYGGLIDDGALTVMVGHIAMPAYQKALNPDFPDALVPATQSPELLQGLLRGKLGFNGLICTDSTIMAGFCVGMPRARAVPYSIEAGCDTFLFSKNIDEDFGYMVKGYEEGILSEKRLDEALTRILAAKAALGLHKKTPEELVPGEERWNALPHDTYAAWADGVARDGITLVKDTAHLLPISPEKTKRVLLEIVGENMTNELVKNVWKSALEAEGFAVSVFKFDLMSAFSQPKGTAAFAENYDLVVFVGNIENTSCQVCNRIKWDSVYGLGDGIPWFTAEVPTLFVSLANPYHLLDVPQIHTYVNCYSGGERVIRRCIDKLTGKEAFTGVSPVDPFCGKAYLKY